MSYEVCPGQRLRYSGVIYPEGALVPPGAEVASLEAAGVSRKRHLGPASTAARFAGGH